jgi:L-alanine-DL-glutamate epimerase-like enolase superfamily enzyme
MAIRLNAVVECFPIRGAFVISRERRTVQTVVRVTIDDGGVRAQAECVPYKRYDETPDGVIAAILAQADAVAGGLTRAELQTRLPAGAARNGLDCALWDYEAKKTGTPVWKLAGLPKPKPVTTMQTISLGTPEDMRSAAQRLRDWPILKIKLGGDGDVERIHAVREGAPNAQLVADANEAWRETMYEKNLHACLNAKVALIEQPFPAGNDVLLEKLPRFIPVCADESLHDRHNLGALRGRYDAVNIKLDKAGGLTEALLLKEEAKKRGFKIFIGSMLATSLSIAPAILLAQGADFVDLDGPLLLAKDRENPLCFQGAMIMPVEPVLWG